MTKPLVPMALSLCACLPGLAGAAEDSLSAYQSCLLEYFESAEADVPVGVIREQCHNAVTPVAQEALSTPATEPVLDPVLPEESLVDNRIDAERATRSNPFVLSPHKQNYVLLASYNDTPNYGVYNLPESDYDRIEMKFQLSFKIPVVEGLFGSRTDLYAAYTNLSFWQAYNRDISSPFRETVHEPELFLVVPDLLPDEWQWQGWRNELMQFGVVHQSNGQGGYLSRSWNRLYANFLFEKDNYILGIKPWYRIPEDNDDNPDIEDYLGHYELYGFYKHQDQTFSLMLRNLFDGENRDTAQLDWSFPLYRHWRGYMQYFYGYGESLIDYNARSHRIGFGLQLTDWL
ncbi:MAG: phospholipase A [Candidatus Thiodiazotropha sp.]